MCATPTRTMAIAPMIAQYKADFLAKGLTNSEVADKITELKDAGIIPVYDYEITWLIFIGLTILALIVAFLLKLEDKRKNYGLEQPNIQD